MAARVRPPRPASPARNASESTKWQTSPSARPPPSSRSCIQCSAREAAGVHAVGGGDRPTDGAQEVPRLDQERREAAVEADGEDPVRGRGGREDCGELVRRRGASGFSQNTCFPASSAACGERRVALVPRRDHDGVDVGRGDHVLRAPGRALEAEVPRGRLGGRPRAAADDARAPPPPLRRPGRAPWPRSSPARRARPEARRARSACARAPPTGADDRRGRLGLRVASRRIGLPAPAEQALVGRGSVVDGDDLVGQVLEPQQAPCLEVEDRLHVPAFGPAHVADRIVEATLLVGAVVAPRPVRARDAEGELLVVEEARAARRRGRPRRGRPSLDPARPPRPARAGRPSATPRRRRPRRPPGPPSPRRSARPRGRRRGSPRRRPRPPPRRGPGRCRGRTSGRPPRGEGEPRCARRARSRRRRPGLRS